MEQWEKGGWRGGGGQEDQIKEKRTSTREEYMQCLKTFLSSEFFKTKQFAMHM